MRSRRTLFLVLCLASGPCWSQQGPWVGGMAQGAKQIFRAPVQQVDGVLLVDLSVNGTRNQSFLIDSGFSATVISSEAAIRLNLAKGGPGEGLMMTSADSSAKHYALTSRAVRIDYGKFGLYEGPIRVLDLENVARELGRPISGILGFDVLKHSRYILNLADNSLTLFSNRSKRHSPDLDPKGCDAGPVLKARLSIGGRSFAVMLQVDTGSNAALELFSPFVAKNELANGTQDEQKALIGVGGTSPAVVGGPGEVLIGDEIVSLEKVYYSRAEQGMTAVDAIDGNLGTPALAGRKVYFDCPDGKFSVR